MRFIPHWRKATWTIVIWTALMAALAIAAANSGNQTCARQTYASSCSAWTAIDVMLLVLIWFIGFIVVGLIWLLSRPRRRLCPVCGHHVKKGLIACQKCGYNFAAAATAGAVSR